MLSADVQDTPAQSGEPGPYLPDNWLRAALLGAAVSLQVICALFFTADLVLDFIYPSDIPDYRLFMAFECFAVFSLWLAVWLGARQLARLRRRHDRMADQLAVATGAFQDLLDVRFAEWELTEAERDVALLILKGMSTAEIADLRSSATGTVKSQSSAIYRKSGHANRAQLISSFIEDLL